MVSKKHSTQLIMNFFLKKLKAIVFSDGWITWFLTYLSEIIYFINIENQLSDYGRIWCGVPQGSILRPLLLLIYVNAVNPNLFLYADDSYLMFQHKEVEQIEKVLNNDFEIFAIGLLIIN